MWVVPEKDTVQGDAPGLADAQTSELTQASGTVRVPGSEAKSPAPQEDVFTEEWLAEAKNKMGKGGVEAPGLRVGVTLAGRQG